MKLGRLGPSDADLYGRLEFLAEKSGRPLALLAVILITCDPPAVPSHAAQSRSGAVFSP